MPDHNELLFRDRKFSYHLVLWIICNVFLKKTTMLCSHKLHQSLLKYVCVIRNFLAAVSSHEAERWSKQTPSQITRQIGSVEMIVLILALSNWNILFTSYYFPLSFHLPPLKLEPIFTLLGGHFWNLWMRRTNHCSYYRNWYILQ